MKQNMGTFGVERTLEKKGGTNNTTYFDRNTIRDTIITTTTTTTTMVAILDDDLKQIANGAKTQVHEYVSNKLNRLSLSLSLAGPASEGGGLV